MQTSRAAPRPGTAAVVKISASMDVVSVSPRGSVVAPGSASFKPLPAARAHKRSGLVWGFSSTARFFVFQLSPGMFHKRHPPSSV